MADRAAIHLHALLQSSDLFRLVNKSKSVKSVQHLKDYARAAHRQAASPKTGHGKAGGKEGRERHDKTVCSEEELKVIQKERAQNQNQSLSLNKPYLKSATDLTSLTRKEKGEKKKKS